MVETVIVKDKNGKPIEGLTAKDFTVTEDGVPQTIASANTRSWTTTPARRAAAARPPLAAPQAFEVH